MTENAKLAITTVLFALFVGGLVLTLGGLKEPARTCREGYVLLHDACVSGYRP